MLKKFVRNWWLFCIVGMNGLVLVADELKKDDKKIDAEKIAYDWTQTFAEIVHLALEKHFNTEHLEQAFTKAMDAFLIALDPHSGFLDPKTYKAMLEVTSGEFFGIGIAIDNTRKARDKFLLVSDTEPDGPADKAGILPLDKIVEIEGESLEHMTTEEATTKLRGERGTKVKVKVLREGQLDFLNFEITRDVIKDHTSLSFFLANHNIYYLSLSTFAESAVKQMEEILKTACGAGCKGIILDLRNNTGGLLNVAVDIAGLFLPKNSLVVSTKDKTGADVRKYSTQREPLKNAFPPICILINSYTASAAEILTGFLKTHAEKDDSKLLVFVVGKDTFGKGSVQEVIPVANCAIKLTTALYYLPNNTTVQGCGIKPDFTVDRTTAPTEQMLWFTKHYGREAALDNFIKAPAHMLTSPCDLDGDKKKKEQKNETGKGRRFERAKQILLHDNQVKSAIELLNTFEQINKQSQKKIATRRQALELLGNNFVPDESLDIREVKLSK